MSNARRWIVGSAAVVAIVATAMGASAVPPPADAMPDVLWVAGLGKNADNDALRFRVGAADGAEFEEPRVHSTWGKTNDAPSGVSVRRALHGWAKTRANLASHGILPIAEIAAAGYEATGRERAIDGVSWREMKKFDDEFNSWSVGWWLAARRLWSKD